MLRAKLLAAASESSSGPTPPPTPTVVYGYNTPVMVASGTSTTNYNVNNVGICPGRTATNYVVSGVIGTDAFLWNATYSGGYVTLTNRFNVPPDIGTAPTHVDINSISSTEVCVIVPSNNGASVNKIDISGSNTFSDSLGGNAVSNVSTGLIVVLSCVLNSSNGIVFLGASSTSNNVFGYFNPGTATPIQQNKVASTIDFSNQRVRLNRVNNSRAILCWQDASNNMKFATIDTNGSTTSTLNAAVTGPSVYVSGECIAIDDSTVLCVYLKDANTVAARTLTVGSGGSITINSEYTYAVAETLSPFVPMKMTKYGSSPVNYVVGFKTDVNSNSTNDWVLAMTVSGNVVSFDTNGKQIINRINQSRVSNNFSTGKLITLDTSNLAASYGQLAVGSTSCSFTGVIQANPTTQTWNTLSKSAAAYSLGASASSYATNPNPVCFATNRVLTAALDGSNVLNFYQHMHFGGADGFGLFSSGVSTSITNVPAVMVPLSYCTSANKDRVLAAYASDANTVRFRVVSLLRGTSTPILETATNLSITGVGQSNGTYHLIKIDDNSALFLNKLSSGSNDTLFGNIVTVNTGALTISSTGTNTSLFTESGTILSGQRAPQFCRIDSTKIAMIYQRGSPSVVRVVMITISGSTVTFGTPQTLYTNGSNFSDHYGVMAFTNGTGIAWYTGNGNTDLRATPFTYAGSTITLGTENSIGTGLSFASNAATIGVQPTSVRTSDVSGVIAYRNGSNEVILRTLTYAGTNTVNASSTTTLATADRGYLIESDIPNSYFGVYYPVTTTGAYKWYYR